MADCQMGVALSVEPTGEPFEQRADHWKQSPVRARAWTQFVKEGMVVHASSLVISAGGTSIM
jgi:hypothetical protein